MGPVETWRIIAVVLLGVFGLPFVLVVMAKVRDRADNSGAVAIGGVVTLTALLVLGVLMLTALPGVLTWILVAAVATAVSVMMLAS